MKQLSLNFQLLMRLFDIFVTLLILLMIIIVRIGSAWFAFSPPRKQNFRKTSKHRKQQFRIIHTNNQVKFIAPVLRMLNLKYLKYVYIRNEIAFLIVLQKQTATIVRTLSYSDITWKSNSFAYFENISIGGIKKKKSRSMVFVGFLENVIVIV